MNVTSSAQGAVEGVEASWQKLSANRKIREWRESVGWSAERLAREMGYRGRSYVKHMESKTKPWFITRTAAKKLKRLMETVPAAKKVRLEEPKRTQIFSRYVLPAKVYLYVRPRRCRGHNRPSFMSATQVYCGVTARERAECRKLWKRRERKRERGD